MYNSQSIAEKIKDTAKLRGVTIKKLLEETGLSSNTMSNLKTSVPKADNLAKIADYLNCSVDYLLGRTETIETIHFPNELMSSINDIIQKNSSDFDDFIIAKDIIQAPISGNGKDYFVREIHFEQVIKMYETAKSYKSNIMEFDSFKEIFKYCKFKILGYDASGYSVTPADYITLMNIYKIYVESYLASIFAIKRNE